MNREIEEWKKFILTLDESIEKINEYTKQINSLDVDKPSSDKEVIIKEDTRNHHSDWR